MENTHIQLEEARRSIESAPDKSELLFGVIEEGIVEGASDVHFAPGYLPIVRSVGTLIPLTKYKPLTTEDIGGIIKVMLNQTQMEHFFLVQEMDFSYSYKGETRFRGNLSFAQGQISVALRHIPNEIKTIEELRLPPIIEDFANHRQGFFLVVGPVGQGKSTTLAALVESINTERSERIVTIEDPVEYVFRPKQSMIMQREARMDTKNFKAALQSALRQDVNVIMVGEMRGADTIAAGVTAAETGHLVFSTLHTNNAAQTIDRIIDSFPPNQQDQIRMQLSASLTGIFSQRLVPSISGGQVPAYELLINNKAVSNLIREKRTHEINTVIETRSEEGMISMNQSLSELVRRGEITVEAAFHTAINPKELERLL